MYKLIAVTMSLGGCVAQPPSGGSLTTAVVPPVSGVYDVTVATATGDCAPATVSGPLLPLQEAIDASLASKLRVQMPDVVGRVSTFAMRDLEGYRWQQSTDSCGAHVDSDVTAIAIAADALTLVRSELWSNTASRMRGAAAAAGADDGDGRCDYVPPHDCGSSVTLRYELVQPCAPPCQVQLAQTPTADGFPALSCVCGAGSGD
jgi:hypothetical protein